MGLKECASMESVLRGYNYYKENRVLECKKESETTFTAVVKGSDDARYHVYIDILHPRKSKCDCPHANGKRIVCKHQMATFFNAFPEEGEAYEKELRDELEEEEAEYRKEIAIEKYLDGLSKEELKEEIYGLLGVAPDWVGDLFLERVNFDEDDSIDDEDFELEEAPEDWLEDENPRKNFHTLEKPVNRYILTMRLRDTDIWRTVTIMGNYSFTELHDIIQIVFGWDNYHAHQFEVGKMTIGVLEDEDMLEEDQGADFKFEPDVSLELVLLNYKDFVYRYDFGDDWQVDIHVDAATPTQTEIPPMVLEFGGSMAAEDCGGAEGLMKMKRIKTNVWELNLILEELFEK